MRRSILGGLGALRYYGLNTEIPEDDYLWLEADGEALSRAREVGGVLIPSLDDALLTVFKVAVTRPEKRYWLDFFTAVYLVNIEDVDLSYMLRRAARLSVKDDLLKWLESVDWLIKYGWSECELLPENYTTYHWLADRYLSLKPPFKHTDRLNLNSLVELVRKELVWHVKLIPL